MVKVSDVECEDLEKVGTRTILKVIKASTREKRKEERRKVRMCCYNSRSDVEGGRSSVKHTAG